MTPKNHCRTHSPTSSLQVLCSFMHMSRSVMKTSQFRPWTLLSLLSWIQSELDHKSSVPTCLSVSDPVFLRSTTPELAPIQLQSTPAQSSVSKHEQWPSSALFSLQRLWWDDTHISLGFCLLLCGAVTHCICTSAREEMQATCSTAKPAALPDLSCRLSCKRRFGPNPIYVPTP